MKLTHKQIRIADITDAQKEKMFSLMDIYYANSQKEVFENDLVGKDWVLMLQDEKTDDIVGFSTQKLIHVEMHQKKYAVVFSGDTIIAREYWGSTALNVAFCEMMFGILQKDETIELYWWLISKGLRTYKYLPLFFNEYYPNYKTPTPENIQELMDYVSTAKFGGLYDSQSGVIAAKDNGQFLKSEFQPEPNLRKPHEQFFVQKNPKYNKGYELSCFARFSTENLHPFVHRLLQQHS